MSFRGELESSMFYFGFRECKKKNNLNFLKLSEQDYLILRVSTKVEIADLIHAKFSADSNPCDSEPYWEETVKLGFLPNRDSQVIRDFMKLYEKK